MLKNISDTKLVTLTQTKVKEEKKLTVEILSYLQEIQNRNLYTEYGVNSLFKFCTRILKYSDSEAALRVKAIRVIKKAPTAKKKLETGDMNLSTVSLLDNFFHNNKNSEAENDKLVTQLSGKSKKEGQEILNNLDENPAPRTLKLTLQERLLKKLESVQKDFDDCSELEVIEALLDRHIEEKKAMRKQRSERGSKNQRYITRKVKEAVDKRAGQRCEGKFSGKRCNSRTHLSYDQIKPIAIGGSSEFENIRKLCTSCNQRAGRRALERKKWHRGPVQKRLEAARLKRSKEKY